MRCSLIIASFALVLLAAPVPQGQALAIEKRGQPNSETSNLVHSNINRAPEPLQRGQHDRREPEPLQRGQYDRRDPEAEPGVHDTNQEQSRPIHPRSVVDISLRDIYNSAAGVVQSLKTRDFNNAIIEALKGRGFSSANLLEPM